MARAPHGEHLISCTAAIRCVSASRPAEIGGYLRAGKYNYRGVRLPETAPLAERPMSAAEAHTIRLSLPWIDRGVPRGARAQRRAVDVLSEGASPAARDALVSRRARLETACGRPPPAPAPAAAP